MDERTCRWRFRCHHCEEPHGISQWWHQASPWLRRSMRSGETEKARGGSGVGDDVVTMAGEMFPLRGGSHSHRPPSTTAGRFYLSSTIP